MGTETFRKAGKKSKHPKATGDLKQMRLSGPGAKKECAGAPDPFERKYARRYRKTALGEQQYGAEPKGGFADQQGLPGMGMFRGY
jgi:hypothetical protein